MKVQHKILLLLIIAFTIIGSTLLGYQYIKSIQKRILLEANKNTRDKVIRTILEIKAESIKQPANDYSIWDDLIDYINKPNKKWEEANLSSILQSYNLSHVWIFNQKVEKVYALFDSSTFDTEIFLTDSIIKKAFGNNYSCHFFIGERDTLIEICGYTVVPSFDTKHQTNARGYFLTAKFWDKKYIQSLETAMDFEIEINNQPNSIELNCNNEVVCILKDFRDPFNRHILNISFISPNLFAKELSSTDTMFFVLTLFLIATFSGLFIAIRFWVNLPLVRIAKCLLHEDLSMLKNEGLKRDEFGEISKLIATFFHQKKHLEKEIENRKQIQKKNIQLLADTHILNRELQTSEEELKQNLQMVMVLNEELARQKKDITDSINYASRIQAALLPPIELINKLFDNYFIFNRPKNIISGDFYWIARKNNKIVIAVADCTGHGVPGGFMSILGMAYLTEVVNQSNKLISSEILENLRSRLIGTLHQTIEIGGANDGMDMALCILDKKTMNLEFSGAYNSLCLVKTSVPNIPDSNYHLIELKGDRMPVGIYRKLDRKFTVQTTPVEKGDMVYLFSDGFQDQIGGKNQEKFKNNSFKELLVYLADKPVEEQKNLIELSFDGFRGDNKQTDDVLVFGIRI